MSCMFRVAVVERGPLQGRQQEWNISRKELQELVSVFSPTCAPCPTFVKMGLYHSSACCRANSGMLSLHRLCKVMRSWAALHATMSVEWC